MARKADDFIKLASIYFSFEKSGITPKAITIPI